MSNSSQDPLTLAAQAERDLNSNAAKQGLSSNAGDSTTESGVDDTVTQRFPGATVTYGSAASGAGDNREIPAEEGGGENPVTGKPYKARDFEGAGGPEDKEKLYAEANPGNDDVRENVR